jgi:hypothetical protein
MYKGFFLRGTNLIKKRQVLSRGIDLTKKYISFCRDIKV